MRAAQLCAWGGGGGLPHSPPEAGGPEQLHSKCPENAKDPLGVLSLPSLPSPQ